MNPTKAEKGLNSVMTRGDALPFFLKGALGTWVGERLWMARGAGKNVKSGKAIKASA